MNRYHAILVDDCKIFRQGLKKLIEEMPGAEVIGEVSNGFELLRFLEKTHLVPDIIILDISMPKLRGIETAREVRALYPQARILVLTIHKSREYLYRAISAGAQGYLLKEDCDEELFLAMETIRKGGIYITRHLSEGVAEDLAQVFLGKGASPFEPLTTREREVLKFVAEGKSNRDAAAALFISVRTVENHRARIMKKLNMKNTAELVRYALGRGIIADA